MILDEPFATREHILAAFRPGGDTRSDSPLKTLRKRNAVSDGISIALRSEGRLRGRNHLYSALCIHAARLLRRGFRTDAMALARAAAELEALPVAREAAEALAAGEDTSSALLELALASEQALVPFRPVLNGFLHFGAALVVDVTEQRIVLADEDGNWPAHRDLLPDLLAVPGTPIRLAIETLGAAGSLFHARRGVWLGERPSGWDSRPLRSPIDAPVLTPLAPRPSQEAALAGLADALGSLRAEGLVPSAEAVALARRIVTGEITGDEARRQLGQPGRAPRLTATEAGAPPAGRASPRAPRRRGGS